MVHDLKCWTGPYLDVRAGRKPFEIRRFDRPFAVGDYLKLNEWHPGSKTFTGCSQLVEVTYLVKGGEWGLPLDLCVMGVRLVCGPAEPGKGTG